MYDKALIDAYSSWWLAEANAYSTAVSNWAASEGTPEAQLEADLASASATLAATTIPAGADYEKAVVDAARQWATDVAPALTAKSAAHVSINLDFTQASISASQTRATTLVENELTATNGMIPLAAQYEDSLVANRVQWINAVIPAGQAADDADVDSRLDYEVTVSGEMLTLAHALVDTALTVAVAEANAYVGYVSDLSAIVEAIAAAADTPEWPWGTQVGVNANGERDLTQAEKTFLDTLFRAAFPGIQDSNHLQAELAATLSKVHLYDISLSTQWWWPKFVAANGIITYNEGVAAVTLGADQFYRRTSFPSENSNRSLPLLAHETVHSFHAELVMGAGTFLIGYGVDSLAAGVYEGDFYHKNLSEMQGHAMQDTVSDLLLLYPNALDWFDPTSSSYGQQPGDLFEWIRKRFNSHLSAQMKR